MWSGPRNLSTAMMRSWENRPDCEVIDEPLYAWHLAETGMDHPLRDEVIASGPADLREATRRCVESPADSSRSCISYQKHMSAHLPPDGQREWLDALTHGLLLRHPFRVMASYTQKWELLPLHETGLPQQLALLDRARVVIDSDDFLRAPRAYLEAMCESFGVSFVDAMLAWPAGGRSTDGIWASVWYDSVKQSTGFGPPPGPLPTLRDLPIALQSVAAQAVDLYNELHAHRLLLR